MGLAFRAVTVAAMVALAACGGYSPIRYPALPAPDMLTLVVANPQFRHVDGTTFANAVMLYPTRTGADHHSIPVGDYLLSRTVLALPENAAISSLKLTSYRSVCEPTRVVAPQLRCVTRATFVLGTNSGERAIEVSASPDVGPQLLPGDFSFPFTMGDYFTEEVHRQARVAIDGFQEAMRQSFAALPRRS